VDAVTSQISERVLMLGTGEALAAALARPVGEPQGPAVLILNAGVVHRVGHHRMSVTLARRLARAGHIVLRFDFAGIGDSPSMTGDAAPLEANMASIRELLDWIERSFGVDRFVLIGLCSGADQAAVYASDDPRVIGVALLDPSVPRTWRYRLIDVWRRLSRREPWLNIFLGRGRFWNRLRSRLELPASSATPRGHFSRANLEHPEVVAFLERTYQRTVENGTEILAVFTAGPDFQHNYRTQILDALPGVRFGDKLDLHFFGDCDHTFTREWQRERLFRLIESWLETRIRRRLLDGACLMPSHAASPKLG
jgi:pimeloyl-ACP methyl ester carboxylesterase